MEAGVAYSRIRTGAWYCRRYRTKIWQGGIFMFIYIAFLGVYVQGRIGRITHVCVSGFICTGKYTFITLLFCLYVNILICIFLNLFHFLMLPGYSMFGRQEGSAASWIFFLPHQCLAICYLYVSLCLYVCMLWFGVYQYICIVFPCTHQLPRILII